MKSVGIAFGSALLFSAFVTEATANCTTDPRVPADTVIPGALVCGRAVMGNDHWQEQHRGSGSTGDIFDFKQGPGDAVDPETKVGTWTITGPIYTANYGGMPYMFAIHKSSTNVYSFCNTAGSEVAVAFITPGGGVPGQGCSGAFP